MATGTVGDVIVSVGADISPLRRGLDQAGNDVRGFGRGATAAAAGVARAGAAIVAAMAAAGVAVTALAADAASAGAEIARLSRVANSTPGEFQRWAAAAAAVGIEQEKLGDILKDVNDRVGDFFATGAGPMVDFFDNIAPKVGVTAEQFRNLSGPQALQLYVSSLEAAGASQQDMTFYLEAMASDATALIPVLRDGGAALAAIGDEAARTGRVMSDEAVAAAVELDRKFSDMGATLKGSLRQALLDNADDFSMAADAINETIIPALAGAVTTVADFIGAVARLGAIISDTLSRANEGDFQGAEEVYETVTTRRGRRTTSVRVPTNQNTGTPLRGSRMTGRNGARREVDLIPELMPPEDLGGSYVLPDILVTPDDPPGGGGLPPVTPDVGGSGGGGGGGRGPDRDGFERLQARLATEAELIAMARDDQLAAAEEFRAAEISSEEEHAEAKRRIHEEYTRAVQDLDAQAAQARLQALSGMFGDVSSLMASENQKLFKIGQAAALADVAVTGYQAATDAWAKGMKIGGPPVAAAFAGASLVRTASYGAAILSQSPSGGGGRGAAVGGGVPGIGAATAAPEPPRQITQVSLDLGGQEFFSRRTVLGLMEQMQEIQRNGGELLF